MRLLAAFFILAVFSGASSALAQSSSKKRGLMIEGGLGLPSASLSNPDGTSAYYTGISLLGRGILPVWQGDSLALSLTGAAKYQDLRNTANTAGSSEYASHIGPGVGLRVDIFRFYGGYEYNYLLARHYAVGYPSKSIELYYMSPSYYVGFGFPLGALSVGLSYYNSSGEFAAADTGLSTTSKYTETTYYLHLTWNTGASLGKVFKNLFK